MRFQLAVKILRGIFAPPRNSMPKLHSSFFCGGIGRDGPQDAGYCVSDLLPLGFFVAELFLARGGEAVELELAVANWGELPLCGNPAFAFHTVKSWVKRAVLDLQDVVSGALNVFGDLVAVGGAEEKSAEDEHIEGALEELGA